MNEKTDLIFKYILFFGTLGLGVFSLCVAIFVETETSVTILEYVSGCYFIPLSIFGLYYIKEINLN